MLYDLWRNSNLCAEHNSLPSMTEPIRLPAIQDYLRDPSLILRQHIHDVDEPGDDVPDVSDNFDFEVPRDPDLYTNMRPVQSKKPRAKDNGSKDPKPGARSENDADPVGGDERAPGAKENRVATEDK